MFRPAIIKVLSLVISLGFLFAGKADAARLQADYLFETYLIGSYHQVRNSPLNPANQILQLPELQGVVDLRPEFSLQYGKRYQLTTRPRIRAFLQSGTNLTDKAFARFHFDEASVKWRPSGRLTIFAGIHYIQWGPAELFSPSNPLIHFYLDQKSIIFRMRGKALVQANYFFTRRSFVSAIVEPLSNGEPDFVAGYPFVPRGLLRWEKQVGRNPGDYFGVTAGRMERENFFGALYGNTYLDDYWSIYADARVSPGSPAIYPDATSPTGFTAGRTNGGKIYTLSTFGVRYEGFFDTRLEYILNTYGFDQTQWDTATTIARTNPVLAAASFQSGLEIPRQHYLYTSLRTDRLGKGDEFRIAVRYLHSLSDHSGAFFTAWEWNFNPNCTWIVEPMFTHGGDLGEFSQGAQGELFTELRIVL